MKKLIFFTVFTVFVSSLSHAGWIDDWIQQKTVSGPTSFETQKRGYFSPGGVSYRWNKGRDYLVSATPPAFSHGCGGVDLFTGSVSFLKFERLVEKLKNIMSGGAGAFAFDIALGVLCEKCSSTTAKFEAIIDRLNGLQIDDCKASKGVTAVLKGWKNGSNETAAKLTASAADYIQTTGLGDLFYDTVESNDQGNIDQAIADSGGSKADMVSECPEDIRNIFFADGSLLANINTTSSYGFDNEHIRLMRALVGDIFIAGMNYNFVPPCSENDPDDISAVIHGEIYIRNEAADCVKIAGFTADGDSFTDLSDFAFRRISAVAQAMLDGTSLNDKEKKFVSDTNEPVYLAVKSEIQASGRDDPDFIAGMYSDFAATSYAYYMIRNVLSAVSKIITKADVANANAGSSESGQDQSRCQLQMKDVPYQSLLEMREIVKRYSSSLDAEYSRRVAGFNSRLMFSESIAGRQGVFSSRVFDGLSKK